jgi:hypothetical protein
MAVTNMYKLTLNIEGIKHLNRMALNFRKDPLDETLYSVRTNESHVSKFIEYNHLYTDGLNNLRHRDTDCLMGFYEEIGVIK